MADDPSHERKIKLTKSGKIVKKRSRNPEEWHKQKQKRLRIAGLQYINSNGKLVPAKQPGPDCQCKRKCYERVPEDVRLKTFQGFYSMKSHDDQNAYLFGLMRQIDVKRKRVKSGSRRTCTFEYFVRVKGRETQVCQTAFKNIHAITERKVRVLCKKMDDGIMFPSDNRGRNSCRRAGEVRLPSAVLDQIKSHIFSIVHTHKLKDFIRLDKVAGLEINISKMWKDYIKTYDPENVSATLPKPKRLFEVPIVQSEPSQSAQSQPTQTVQQVQESNYTPVNYPSNNQVVNIENFFQLPYPNTTSLPTNPNSGNYYQTQNGAVLLQPATAGRAQPTTYIVLQAKTDVQQELSLLTPVNSSLPCQITIVEPPQKPKTEKKKGPLVKQWRYANIFHDEINGAALAAIKTRLAMYYAESDAGKKKVAKSTMKIEPVQNNQQQNPLRQVITVYSAQ